MGKIKHTSIEILFVLTLFGIYTLCSLFVSVVGADIYQKNVDASEANYNMRTSVLYLMEKVRQNEVENGIAVKETDTGTALVLREEFDGYVYETWIYTEDGYLCELFIPADSVIIPGIGQKIMPVQELSVENVADGILSISVVDTAGNLYSSNIFVETSKEGGVLHGQ